MYQAVAEGTLEGEYGMTPRKYLRVPAPTKQELKEVGYTEEQAERSQGGPVNDFDLEGEAGLWNWRGWYRSFWRHQDKLSEGNFTMRNPMGPSWREQRNMTKTYKIWKDVLYCLRHPGI